MENLDSLLKKIFDHLQEDRTQLANNINLPAMAKQYQQGLADLTKAIINKVATAPEDSETAKVLIDIVSHLQKKPQAAAATNQAAVVQEKSSPAPQIQRSMEATATKVAGVAANIPAPPPSLSTPAPATAKALDSLNTREKPKAASTASATPSTAATQSNIDVTFTVLLSQRTKVREIIKNQTNPDVRPWPPQAKKEGDAAKATATFSYRESQMADVASELAKLDPRPKMSPDCNSKFKDAFKKAALEQDISEAKNVQTPRKG